MEEDKPEYCGLLFLPPIGKILLKKSWQQKYCLLYKSSKFGIERLEIYDNKDLLKVSVPRIITLENCVKITKKSDKCFSVITKTSMYEFGTDCTTSLEEWVKAFQSVAFAKDSSGSLVIEDNDLYCSSGEGVFSVKLHSSDASERCNLEPIFYTLVLTSNAIQLRNCDGKLLYTWPYHFIRRYGYRDGKFTFEAGRKCETGEGTFYLEHSNQQEIFRCLASKMNSMKKLLKGESTPPILNCGENQFHAALSMEARSRSPLPPSPTTSTSLHDIDVNISNKTQMTILDSSIDLGKSRKPLPKPKPRKPPRKNLEQKDPDESNLSQTTKSVQTYEQVNKYDEVEYRNGAWRTLGVDEIKHTEAVNEDNCDDDEYKSWSVSRKEPINTVVQTKAPKIIMHTSTSSLEEESYDTLDFFGSNSKLNVNKSGYKQISHSPLISVPATNVPSFNEYDEVEPIMEGVRLADDSHLGYALIRKETKVDHHFQNEEPYAVISKPKRV